MTTIKQIGRIFAVVVLIISFVSLITNGQTIAAAADANNNNFTKMDFSSKRLLVMTKDPNIIVDKNAVISFFDGVYLLQFDDEETTIKAYAYYAKKADAVSPDESIAVCDDAYLSEENNPISELIKITKVVEKEEYDVALIDTGAKENLVVSAVSVIGETAEDGNGHGTRMAEIIRSQNQDAKILSIKALGDDGYGDISAVIAAIEYALSQNVKIINLSISAFSSEKNSVLEETINKAVNNGIVVVGSAGNNGFDAKYFVPGNIDEAIICGSCDEEGLRLESSNYGDRVDINVVSSSTSEAAAKMSGFLSTKENYDEAIQSELNKGLFFEPDYKDYSPNGKKYQRMNSELFEIAERATFWTDPNFGDADLLYYGNVNGVTVPAYCIDHGIPVPEGTYDSFSAVHARLGYVMKNGYPNTNWGLSWHEAQYITQCAVMGVLGVPLYEVSDGQMPPSWIYDQVWAGGHFDIVEELIAGAINYATDEYVIYATFWAPNNGYSQRVVTPTLTGTLTINKKSSATGDVLLQLDGNKMYSQDFSGAEFSVKVKHAAYETWSDNTVYKTDTKGIVTISDLLEGDEVEITEVKAPDGYLIPEENTKTITIIAGSNSVTFEDDPTLGIVSPLARKVTNQNGVLIDNEPIEGAVYKLEYFDNMACEGDAKRTWYFVTDKNGEFSYRAEDLAADYENDSLYVDVDGINKLPLGSVRMTEEKAPNGYLKSEEIFTGSILQNDSRGEAVFTWNVLLASKGDNTFLLGEKELVLAVDKIDSGTKEPLSGAVMQLMQGKDVLKEWTTDGTTVEIKNILTAGVTYKIHEKLAPDGYQTATDIEFSFDEDGVITVISEDIETFETDKGYVGIKVKDIKKVSLPLTGSKDGLWMIILGALVLAGGLFSEGVLYRKKMLRGNKKDILANHKCFKSVKAMAMILIGITAFFVISQPAYAAGKIEVIGKNAEPIAYKAYLLMEGTYEDGYLLGPKLAKNIPDSIEKLIKENDDGSKTDELAKAITGNKDIEPLYTFKSGDVVGVRDGYYLVVSNDTHPMLIMAGGDLTQTIYEKLIPKDTPKTGDESNPILYIICIFIGFVAIGAGGWHLVKNRKNNNEGKQ